MPLITGINHVAIITADLDRFVTFYRDVFDLEVVFEETNPKFRHAMLLVADGAVLHPVEIAGSAHGQGRAEMTDRGHLDHFALTVADDAAFDTIIERLVARSAATGEVDDLGAVRSTWFVDPDGMRGEVALVLQPRLVGLHEPRPLAVAR